MRSQGGGELHVTYAKWQETDPMTTSQDHVDLRAGGSKKARELSRMS